MPPPKKRRRLAIEEEDKGVVDLVLMSSDDDEAGAVMVHNKMPKLHKDATEVKMICLFNFNFKCLRPNVTMRVCSSSAAL